MLESPLPAKYKTFNYSSQYGCNTPLPLSILTVVIGSFELRFHNEYSLPYVLLNPTLKKYPVDPNHTNFYGLLP